MPKGKMKKSNPFDDIRRTGHTVFKHLSDAFNGKILREVNKDWLNKNMPFFKETAGKTFSKGGGGSGTRTRESIEQQKVKDFISAKPISRRVRNTDFISSSKTQKKGGR